MGQLYRIMLLVGGHGGHGDRRGLTGEILEELDRNEDAKYSPTFSAPPNDHSLGLVKRSKHSVRVVEYLVVFE